MRTKKIYIVLLFAFILGCMQLQSQVVEKEIDGTVFVFNYTKECVENKNNKISKELKSSSCRFKIEQKKPLNKELQTIFSKERARELEDVWLSFTCYCDADGYVHEVRFIVVKNMEKIRLVEFKEMEDLLKTYQFEFSSQAKDCNEKYFRIHVPCRFQHLYPNESE